MSQQLHETTFEDRKLEAHRVASALYEQAPDWVTFFREILGVGGVVRRLFRERTEMLEFERSPEHSEIQFMLARLRHRSDSSKGNGDPKSEPMRVITVRLPQSLHATLQAEAADYATSINKLCITKLMQLVDGELAGSSPPAAADARAGGP
ncbi:MAG: hypothetical protein MUF48_02485 [Pirellulaceae bacterium]|jgi:predicted HicB family RNase H-like nuclease|nr:hypothetical protein [Pirellulaceae bacterium]